MEDYSDLYGHCALQVNSYGIRRMICMICGIILSNSSSVDTKNKHQPDLNHLQFVMRL